MIVHARFIDVFTSHVRGERRLEGTRNLIFVAMRLLQAMDRT
jgi:hypothetical protein